MTTVPSKVIASLDQALVVAGVDTHKDTHHVAVLSSTGARLGDLKVLATPAGYDEMLAFVVSFGSIGLIGIEGINSYGAGLARFLTASGVPIREIIRPKKAQRRRGKSDPIDAYAAAGQALADGDDLPIAKAANGKVEQIRVLLAVRRSAMKARVAAIRQIKSLLLTAPDTIRTRWSHLDGDALINTLAGSRPGTATTDTVAITTSHALRRLARRHQSMSAEIADIDTDLRVLVADIAPAMLARKGYGVITAAILLVTAGDNPDRLRSNASFAALCGAAPIPASSGKTNRHRLNRGGDRQANWAHHRIALVRLRSDPRTREYAMRLRATGKSSKDVLRCLKRAIARETWHLLVHPEPVLAVIDLRAIRHEQGRTLAQAAADLGTLPSRISELERGIRPNYHLAVAYRDWLNAA